MCTAMYHNWSSAALLGNLDDFHTPGTSSMAEEVNLFLTICHTGHGCHKTDVTIVTEWNCMSPQWQNETACLSSGRMKLVAECVCHHRVVAIFNNLNLINLDLWLLGTVSQQDKCGWEGCKMIPAGCNVVDIRTNRYGQFHCGHNNYSHDHQDHHDNHDNTMITTCKRSCNNNIVEALIEQD